ncbi:MAG: hypothetical protein SPD11_05515 [Sphaerochaetaceae bacterium]|nr:hypothetical protein [Sphaerochaetaceae bacterium]
MDDLTIEYYLCSRGEGYGDIDNGVSIKFSRKINGSQNISPIGF